MGRRSPGDCGSAAAAGALALLLLIAADAAAIPINLTDPNPAWWDLAESCGSLSGPGTSDCQVSGHLGARDRYDQSAPILSISGNDAEFEKSFDAWNATNAADQKWTLANGGALPGGVLNVSVFQTSFNGFADLAGVQIEVHWTYTGVDSTDFFWTQALRDNFQTGTGIVPAHYEMDVKLQQSCQTQGLSELCPPLYPFLLGDRGIADAPMAPAPSGFFEARLMLAKVDFTTRTLTAYEGIHWGFTIIPEPSSGLLLAGGLTLLAGLRRGRPGSRGYGLTISQLPSGRRQAVP